MEDSELLAAWRGGNGEAGETLFARHFDEIYRFFARKIADDVSDLVQNTFLKCVESRAAFRGDSSVRTYLYAIARNELHQHFRSRQRDSKFDSSVSSLRDLGESPSTRIAKQGDAALLVRALEQIPLELQLAVELHFWEGMTGPEVAVVLGIPEGTARSRLRRAIEQLRAAMGKLDRDFPEARGAEVETFEAWARGLRPYEDEEHVG